jgi:hypothetical protein
VLVHDLEEMRRREVHVVVPYDARPGFAVRRETGGEGVVERFHARVAHVGEELDAVMLLPVDGGEEGPDVDVGRRDANEEQVIPHRHGEKLAAAMIRGELSRAARQ